MDEYKVECEQLCFHAPLVLAPDALNSQHEDRWFALGHTDHDRLLFVVFTVRGPLTSERKRPLTFK